MAPQPAPWKAGSDAPPNGGDDIRLLGVLDYQGNRGSFDRRSLGRSQPHRRGSGVARGQRARDHSLSLLRGRRARSAWSRRKPTADSAPRRCWRRCAATTVVSAPVHAQPDIRLDALDHLADGVRNGARSAKAFAQRRIDVPATLEPLPSSGRRNSSTQRRSEFHRGNFGQGIGQGHEVQALEMVENVVSDRRREHLAMPSSAVLAPLA